MDIANAWNEYFGLLTAYATYKFLRDKGMTNDQASEAVLNTINFNRKGEAMNALRPLYYFLNPSLQGANVALKNIIGDAERVADARKANKSLLAAGLAARGSMAIAKWFFLSTAVQGLVSMMFGSDEDDDTLGPLYERIPLSQRMREFSIPNILSDDPNDIVTIPIGYGFPGIGWGLGQIANDYYKGKLSSGDALSDMGKLLGKELSGLPLAETSFTEDPIQSIMRTLMPSVAGGLLDATTGVNRFGSPIGMQFLNENRARAVQGKESTEQFYKSFAEFMLDATSADYTPEQWKAVINGVFPGMFGRIVAGADKMDTDPVKGIVMSIGLNPFYDTGSDSAVEAAYYSKAKDIRYKLKDLNRITPYTGSDTESVSELYQRAIFSGLSQDDAMQIAYLKNTERQLRGKPKELRREIMKQFIRSTK
ncbi:hypothetical protein V757_11620 [Pelistega indica]|uniref:Large polyvalent protein associated domain-containing protein n=1 Tax=Pelistega indica TaxID=1414851 RepID=V8FTF3_9BURK|nr:LPD38 domain-containing protein [Pelistega indica]ETD67171.1 hypothetical protein V757_11620 [Pelistega indica]